MEVTFGKIAGTKFINCIYMCDFFNSIYNMVGIVSNNIILSYTAMKALIVFFNHGILDFPIWIKKKTSKINNREMLKKKLAELCVYIRITYIWLLLLSSYTIILFQQRKKN